MRVNLNKLALLLVFTALAMGAWALVSEYSFASAAGTYTEITGGTVLGTTANDDESFNAIPLGFTFTYNGAAYTEISVQTDAFIAFGPTVVNSTLAISSTTGTNNVAAALNRDLMSRDTGELSYLLSGSAPNRVFTVQWKNYRRIPTSAANDVFNFQIQVQESGNKVVFAYGAFTAVNVTTAQTVQVGLRGDANTDFNNRSTTTDWTATTAGTANNASCRISDTVFPPNGLTFTFTPAQTGTPPLPAQNPVPANNAVNVAIGANLSWSSGGGTVVGYRVYFGTDNPPTNLVNGTTQTGTSYDHPADLLYNTVYYWQIVPYNTDGDAVGCPVWQFTTLADPTVTTYPYEQNFDAATPPALPLGWTTINDNADAYSWETYAGNADTPPNCARIRYNSTIAMNDWMIMPPLVLDPEATYMLTFSYRANSATYPEALKVAWGTAPNPTGLSNVLFDNNNITNVTYTETTVQFDPPTAGTYYIGFQGYSPANMFYLYVDSITLTEVFEILNPPTNLAAEVINNNTAHLSWTAPGGGTPPVGLNDGFETYTDFALTFDPWVTVDVDQSATYGMTGYTWLNAYAAQAFMVFNPATTTPPIATLTAHGGTKMAACFASTTPPNNDWLISPLVTPETGHFFNFYAKSYTATYGLERFKVGVSTTGGTTPASFTIISGANYIQAPVDWTLYSYDLTAYAGQQIRIGIQCVSNDAFIFFVDDVTVGPVPVAREAIASQPQAPSITRSVGTAVPAREALNPPSRVLFGYKVYRDGGLIATLSNPATLSYDDPGLAVGTYSYTVTAYYTTGESVPAGPVSVTINPPTDPPTNLTATVAGNDVTLDWDSPEAPPTGTWITWCNDVLGNSIGTNAAAVFEVAHRWTQPDLTQVAGGTISQVKFVPAYQSCVYTIKVYTGGSATSAGTLVSSQVVPTFTIDEWNLVVLNTPVPIPATGDVYVGYEVNTQGGYPAGCDAGPQIEGKGNMMYWQNTWQTLTQIAPTLTYNWLIQTFVQSGAALKAVELTPIPEYRTVSYSKAPLALQTKQIERIDRPVTGFKVYQDGVLIATINDPLDTDHVVMDLPNGTYVFGVTAVHTTGESVPATVTAVVNVILAPAFFTDGFEDYANFALLFAPWTLVDVDLSATYGITGIDFPGSGGPMAYIVFNPSATTPPITTLTPHGGAKMAASFAATTPPNNDWMVAPRVHLGTNSALKFYAKSHTAQHGLERFRVGISTLPTVIPQGFQYVTGPDYVEAPVTWTEYLYDLSAYDNQNVWIGIRCVSNDAFVFYVDDFSIHSNGGYVGNDDPGTPALATELRGNYPNPFNPSTTISFSVKEALPVSIGIYNARGQLVKTLVSEDKAAGNHSVSWDGRDDNGNAVSSGVYFYKMHAGKYSSTKKMILMK